MSKLANKIFHIDNATGAVNLSDNARAEEQVPNTARALISIPKFEAYLLGATNCEG